MKLISCDNCGVVLDHGKLKFTDDIHNDDGGIDMSKGDYDQNRKDFFAYVKCPVCSEQVFEESK